MIFVYSFMIFVLFMSTLIFQPIGIFIPMLKIKLLSMFSVKEIKKNIENWKLSYLWVMPYLIIFFMKKLGMFDGYIIENILNVSKTMFIFFGMICVYQNINKKIKNSLLSKIIVLMGAMLFSLAFFIYGVLKSLKTEKNN